MAEIYDVLVGGVSLATKYRASFVGEIRASGIDGLISRLGEKIQGNW
jgi:ABC-type transporter MlaC component